MKIHQAYFGDNNGSHNLIASSLENKVVIGNLKLNTDIPASITIKDSYLSGFLVEDYYILTKTMNDPDSERPGMGFSHCLIVPKGNITSVKSLTDLLALFVDDVQKNVQQLPELEIRDREPSLLPLSPNYNDMVNKLTQNLTTVVYLGYENFENDLAQLWNILPVNLRLNLSFTISGSPNEIANEKLTIIHTPNNLEARWSKFPVVKPKAIEDNELDQLRFLIYPNSEEALEFKSFIKDNEIDFQHIHQYPSISKLFNLSKKALIQPDATLLKRVITIINEVIPSPEHGVKFKEQILNLFISNIRQNDTKDFLLLRNMEFSAFPNGLQEILKFMNCWCDSFLIPENEYFNPNGPKLIWHGYQLGNPNWWKNPISERFDQVCKELTSASAGFLWNIWTSMPEIIQHTKLEADKEILITAHFSAVNLPNFYPELTNFCSKNKWFTLHAESISNHKTAKHAIEEQLKIDSSTNLKKHLNLIRKNIGDAVFFTESTSIENKTVSEIAGELLIEHPEYFQDLDINNLNWQIIWYESFLQSNEISVDGKPITEHFLRMVNLVINKLPYVKQLLKAIAKYTGNLYSFEGRSKIWSLLENETKEIILKNTSIYIANNFNPSDWFGFEPELKSYLSSDDFIKNEIIIGKSVGIASKITFLKTVGRLTPQQLIKILKANNNIINRLEADTLLSTIKANSFEETLKYCYQNQRKYMYFSDIAYGCKDMLNTWERWWLSTSSDPISLDDIYKEVDRQNLQYVFQVLQKLGFNDNNINRLKEEYIAGSKGIELMDLCGRLKTYIHSKS